MLIDTRRMLASLQDMRARAKCLKEGLEAEIRLAIDVTISSQALVSALKAFEARFPSVALHLQAGALGVVSDLVVRGAADVGIGGVPLRVDDLLVTEQIGATRMLPLAAPGHPLTRFQGPVPLKEVREHTQLVVTDLTDRTRGRDFNVYAYNIWRMTDVGMKHLLIRAGLGWGGLPEILAFADMAAGRLVRLDLEPYPETDYPLLAITAAANPPGPAASWLIERFREALGGCAQMLAQ